MKKLKQIQKYFIRTQSIQCASPAYHGFLFDKHESNEYVTILLPFAPIFRLVRCIYLHFKFGNMDLRRYYRNQMRIRNENAKKEEK